MFTPDKQDKADRSLWGTPRADLWPVIDELMRPDLDVCAMAWNRKVDRYIGPPGYVAPADEPQPVARDAFAVAWHTLGNSAFCNPPYGDVLPWCRKAVTECRQSPRFTCTLLLRSSHETEWFQYLTNYSARILDLIPRVGFDAPDGAKVSGNPGPSCLFILTYWSVRLPVPLAQRVPFVWKESKPKKARSTTSMG